MSHDGVTGIKNGGETIQVDLAQETVPTQPATWRYREKDVQEDLINDLERAKKDLIDEFVLLGEIRVQEESGLLSIQDYQFIYKLMKRYKHPVVVPTLQLLIDRQREIYLESQQKGVEFSPEYEELAIAFIKLEDEYTEELSKYILEHFDIDAKVFWDSHNVFEFEP